MPTYGYECEKCGHEFEEFQAMSDPQVETCPECQGPVRRLIAAGAGLIFKGSGGSGDVRPSCGAARACCGRDTPCDERPCDR